MQKLLKIDNIMYRVADLKKAEDFYEKVLGLKKVWKDENARIIGFAFEQSDSEIVVHNNPNIPKQDGNAIPVIDLTRFGGKPKYG